MDTKGHASRAKQGCTSIEQLHAEELRHALTGTSMPESALPSMIPFKATVDFCTPLSLRPPSPGFLTDSSLTSQVDLSVDADGIARLVPPDAKAAGYCAKSLQPHFAQKVSVDCLLSSLRFPAECNNMKTVAYPGVGGKTLNELISTSLSSASTKLIVNITCDCEELELLEIEAGDVELHGSSNSTKTRLVLPGLRITGGLLSVRDMIVYATEENRVQAGQLRCTNCSITSRNGCGVLCLQKAKVFLTNCEIINCMRSGIGVNGKHTEIDLQRCTISQNNFSGVGVNHQARSITVSETQIVENGYHGIWLNNGVTAKWIRGVMFKNRLSDKAGPGILHGWDDLTPK